MSFVYLARRKTIMPVLSILHMAYECFQIRIGKLFLSSNRAGLKNHRVTLSLQNSLGKGFYPNFSCAKKYHLHQKVVF
jgi:hypothetical protein